MDEINNKVASSGLVEINLEEFYDPTEKIAVDMKDFLSVVNLPDGDAYLLKEKLFREKISQLKLDSYQDKIVHLFCSVDAIIPTWAYMLLTISISQIAKRVLFGKKDLVEETLFSEALAKINPADYTDAKVVIKGCSKVDVPISAYCLLSAKLRPYVKSMMYGEPCSTVPLYKKTKQTM